MAGSPSDESAIERKVSALGMLGTLHNVNLNNNQHLTGNYSTANFTSPLTEGTPAGVCKLCKITHRAHFAALVYYILVIIATLRALAISLADMPANSTDSGCCTLIRSSILLLLKYAMKCCDLAVC